MASRSVSLAGLEAGLEEEVGVGWVSMLHRRMAADPTTAFPDVFGQFDPQG